MPTPESFLPLKPHWFHILLSLADQDNHGYAIMQEVLDRTAGKVRLSWPTTAAGYRLDFTPNLSPTNWTAVSNEPIVIAPNYNVTNDVTSSNGFYRLRKP